MSWKFTMRERPERGTIEAAPGRFVTFYVNCWRTIGNPSPNDQRELLSKYSQYKPGMDPHMSSGIPNLAKAVRGNSWEKIGQIWYKSMTGFGPTPNMKMKTFANRTRAVAVQLYPSDTAIACAVDAGWKKVGL